MTTGVGDFIRSIKHFHPFGPTKKIMVMGWQCSKNKYHNVLWKQVQYMLLLAYIVIIPKILHSIFILAVWYKYKSCYFAFIYKTSDYVKI